MTTPPLDGNGVLSATEAHQRALTPRQQSALAVLAMIFIAAVVVSAALGQKLMHVGILVVPTASAVYPLACFAAAIMVSIWGYSEARLMCWTGVGILLCITGYIFLAAQAPASDYRLVPDSAAPPLGPGLATYALHFTFAYAASQYVNVTLVAKLKVIMHGELMVVRLFIGPFMGQLCFIAMIMTTYWAHVIHPAHFDSLYASRVVWSLLFSAVAMPVVVLATTWLKRLIKTDVTEDPYLIPFHLRRRV